jgi:hypothetical protein
MLELKVGDRYPWAEGKQPQNGGRPADGTVDGKGFMECPRCHKPAYFFVLIRHDVIAGVELDAEKNRDVATYNLLHTALTCPLCCAVVETTVRCHFGWTGQMLDLKVGDRYPWAEGKQPQNGGRPAGGTVDGEGYMHCPRCYRSPRLCVLVRNDVIVGIEPDAKKHNIPD